MAERKWFDAGEIKPRDIAPNPRCPDCQTGGMWHPEHTWGPCIVTIEGEPCRCEASATPPPTP